MRNFETCETLELSLLYHDDFDTPGISPRSANPRKHSRQRPNLRRYPRGRPHNLQRLCRRVENFAFFFTSFTYFAVVAINPFNLAIEKFCNRVIENHSAPDFIYPIA